MKYAGVVLDLDGTLLTSQKLISDRNMKAIQELLVREVRIIFATARPPRAVRSFLSESLLKAGSFVYYNGAYISCAYSGLDIHESIDAELSSEVIDFCVNLNPDIELGLEVKDEWYSLKEVDYTIRMNVKENPIVKPLEELRKYEASKILLTGLNNYEELRERFSSRLNVLLTDHGKLIQISALKASKESAVSQLCQLIGIPMDKVMVFGDDNNDLGLFKVCGWSVAMGNAVEELKLIAHEITDTNDNDGVAMIIERYL